ncbi:BhlA/UviB family holin-like peptide [Lysinibacillus pakistanensis]|uniref:BhlA/UviB family holin-like peptide n=1 Tax=Lysinibacillus pakistanensis TaxID=759811 RepID=UPI003D2B2970
MDISTLLSLALENGLFPALFVFAFWYIISEHKEREKSQRELYTLLAEDVEKINDVISGIEETIKRVDTNASVISQDVKDLRYMVSSLETTIKSRIKE